MFERFYYGWIVFGGVLFIAGIVLLRFGEPLAWLSIAIGFLVLEWSFRIRRNRRRDQSRFEDAN